MKDFSFWEEYEGFAAGSGRSEKIWLINPDTNQVGLFKFKKDEKTTDHVSECIACQLAELLDIPCAKFELGMYNNREGSISYNILNPNETLVEGIAFITLLYPDYNTEKFYDEKSGKRYSLEMILDICEAVVDVSNVFNMIIFDYLIGNSDRHQNNWALIWNKPLFSFSPLYDNSSSLCAYLSDEQIEGYLGNDNLRWRSLVESKSKSLIRRTMDDEVRPTHLEMMRYLHTNYYGDTYLFVKKVISVVTSDKICDILNTYSDEELPEKKKIIIKKFLLSKVEDLRTLYFGEEE